MFLEILLDVPLCFASAHGNTLPSIKGFAIFERTGDYFNSPKRRTTLRMFDLFFSTALWEI
jgi:hypothetical protein